MRYGWGGEWTEPTIAVAEKESKPQSKYPTWPEGQPLRFRVKGRATAPVDDARLQSRITMVREEYHHYPLGAVQRDLGRDEGWVLEQEFPFNWKPEYGYDEPWSHMVSQIWARMVEHHEWWIELRDPGEFFAFLDRHQLLYTSYGIGYDPIEGVALAGEFGCPEEY